MGLKWQWEGNCFSDLLFLERGQAVPLLPVQTSACSAVRMYEENKILFILENKCTFLVMDYKSKYPNLCHIQPVLTSSFH